MVSYQKENDNYSYFAVFIDIFTRYLFTYPMKSLTGVEMASVMQEILKTLELIGEANTTIKTLKDFYRKKKLNMSSPITKPRLIMRKELLKQSN